MNTQSLNFVEANFNTKLYVVLRLTYVKKGIAEVRT